jgi:hypothetical protein
VTAGAAGTRAVVLAEVAVRERCDGGGGDRCSGRAVTHAAMHPLFWHSQCGVAPASLTRRAPSMQQQRSDAACGADERQRAERRQQTTLAQMGVRSLALCSDAALNALCMRLCSSSASALLPLSHLRRRRSGAAHLAGTAAVLSLMMALAVAAARRGCSFPPERAGSSRRAARLLALGYLACARAAIFARAALAALLSGPLAAPRILLPTSSIPTSLCPPPPPPPSSAHPPPR